jgi:hypothetical protein
MVAPENIASASTPDGDAASFSTEDRALVTAWILSVVVHVSLFAGMVAFPWIARNVTAEGDLHVAATQLEQAPKEVKFSMTPAKSETTPQANAMNEAAHVTPQQQASLNQLTEPRKTDLAIVGIGTGGGEFSKYGLRAGTGGGPQFFGLGGEARAARSVVYVVDRSGSMLETFDDVKKELKRSIDDLRKSQKYHVIFFSSGELLECPPRRLVNAIRASKDVTFEFIDSIWPGGGSETVHAMRRAFELQPDVVYFLSDGNIFDEDELREMLHQLNHAKKVRIFTLAYISQSGRELLEEIAREHDGQFKFVSEYDID